MCGIRTSANCFLYDFASLVNLDVLSVAQMYTILANTDPLQPDNIIYILNRGVYKHCLSTLRFVDHASRYNRVKKTTLMHNLFSVYFVNLYMFREYLGPSSGGITVCIQQLVLIVLFTWLFSSTSKFGTGCYVPTYCKEYCEDNISKLLKVVTTFPRCSTASFNTR